MSHPTFWPKKVFFYPIGNTPPTCFTDNLPPEENANILLLGCGDPRSILYTVAVDHGSPFRVLDITCCDLEPAILARNILLFTLIADSAESDKLPIYWNIFYDLYLDTNAASLLYAQCVKLVIYTESLETWSNSPYGRFLRFMTEDTLTETRRHWSSYSDTVQLSRVKQKDLKRMFSSSMKDAAIKNARSTAICAAVPLSKHFPHTVQTCSLYWKTGLTGNPVDSKDQVNPTFLFSLAGRQFNLHYATDLCSSFHLAPALTDVVYEDEASNRTEKPKLAKNEKDIWDNCRSQFFRWSTSFRSRINNHSNRLIIRFTLGDALCFCEALQLVRSGDTTPTIYTSPWGGRKFHLINPPPLISFNTIDTSNLSDHLGILNILVAAIPLLQRSSSAVLHTNLLARRASKASTDLIRELDFPTIAFLLGIIPTDYASGFTFRNESEEALLSVFMEGRYHQKISWKLRAFVFNVLDNQNDSHCTVRMKETDLANKIYLLYLNMFDVENIRSLFQKLTTGILRSWINHYHRETFVRFLKVVRDTGLKVDWKDVFDNFLYRAMIDNTLLESTNNYQNLCTHLHIHGIYSVDTLQPGFFSRYRSKPAPFQSWSTIPPVVCIVLEVPRMALKVLEDIPVDSVGHPTLECETTSSVFRNIHSSIRPIFGKLIRSESHPGKVTIEEDPQGLNGKSALIISFYVTSWMLTNNPQDIEVGLAIKSTPATVEDFFPKLGPSMRIFAAKLLDRDHVLIMPERPDNPGELRKIMKMNTGTSTHSGREDVTVSLDSNGAKQSGVILTKRINIENPNARGILTDKASVFVKQTTPFCMEVSLGTHIYKLYYPLPVDGSRSKTRIARKSFYIEVEVTLYSEPVKQLQLQPFPISMSDGTKEHCLTLWNVPYLNLESLPMLTLKSQNDWIETHLGSTISDRERKTRVCRSLDIDDAMLGFKESIYAIILRYVENTLGIFMLRDPKEPRPHAIILISALKLDLTSGVVVADAGLIIPTLSTMRLLAPFLRNNFVVTVHTRSNEVRLWKHALPAFAERCRRWKHLSSCEYRQHRKIPLSLEYDGNPLCSCGNGKGLGPLLKKPWKVIAPYATRIALAPIFPLNSMDSVTEGFKRHVKETSDALNLSSEANRECQNCSSAGKPKLLECSGCKMVKYCSKECQLADWKRHKPICRLTKVSQLSSFL